MFQIPESLKTEIQDLVSNVERKREEAELPQLKEMDNKLSQAVQKIGEHIYASSKTEQPTNDAVDEDDSNGNREQGKTN